MPTFRHLAIPGTLRQRVAPAGGCYAIEIRYITLIALLAAVVNGILGCATKSYGRQGALTDYEQSTMTCREIDIESAKVQGWIEHVNKESAFSGRDVLAILGDFGIGNSLERGSAIESANHRSEQLRALRALKRAAHDASPFA